jgi:hypothetical protein
VTLDNILWLAGDGATAIVVALLVGRGVLRTFPIFSSYLAWSLVSDAGAFVAERYFPSSFESVYLIVSIIDSLFQFGVLVELAWSVLRPVRNALPRWSLFAIAGLVAVVGAVVWPFTTGPGLNNFPLANRLIFHLDETFSILRILFFLLLAGCSQLLSIGWRDRELQIATGLGFYSMVSLAVWMSHSSHAYGPQYHLLDQADSASYVCSLGYWAVCFATKEAARREFTPQMQNLLLAMAGTARGARIALTESAVDKTRDRRD